ncbi:MAG TPA: cation-transporting P-type ATPase, partial [Sedimentibacter sp.]|nr:cation-transporting P-type ATPase [Sedimentibacter sp.]
MSKEKVLKEVGSSEKGLTSAEAGQRLGKYGYNRIE